MPYCDIVNHVTVTKTNMITQNAMWLCKNHCSENTAPSLLRCCTVVSAALEVSHRAVRRSQLLFKSPADLHRGLNTSKIWLSYISYLIVFWRYLDNCRCIQVHHWMLFRSLRAHCLAAGRSGNIEKYLENRVRSPWVSIRIVCCFRTELHFADVDTILCQLSLLLGLWSSLSPTPREFKQLQMTVCPGLLPAWLVSAMSPGSPQAVRNWIGKIIRFGSRPVPEPYQTLFCRPMWEMYPSTHRFCYLCVDPAGSISGSALQVVLLIVAFRYPAVNHAILTTVCHCFLWM